MTRMGHDVQMMGDDSASYPALTARAMRVPFTAHSVAPPRLVYEPGPDPGHGHGR